MPPAIFFSTEPTYEWPKLDGTREAKAKRGFAIALSIVAWIALIDLAWPLTNVSVLYVVPLTLVAVTGQQRSLWKLVCLLVFLTYAIFFLKLAISRSFGLDLVTPNYRLVNRTLVALSLIGVAYILKIWIRWNADQADLELPTSVRYQERQLSSTLALLCCVPLVILIASIDILVPANYILAILYPIPLFLCVWTGKRQFLWGMLVVLLLLSALAHVIGPPSAGDITPTVLMRNRLIAAAGLTVLAVLLSRWIEPKSAIRVDT